MSIRALLGKELPWKSWGLEDLATTAGIAGKGNTFIVLIEKAPLVGDSLNML